MLDLVISGYDQVDFEADEINPDKTVLSAKMSREREAGREELDDPVTLAMGTFLPDPPCIMPADDFDPTQPVDASQEFAEVMDYWKTYAGFLQEWPRLEEGRDSVIKFCNLWSNRPVGSRLRAFVVTCPNSIGVRFHATMDEEEKSGHVIRPGQPFAAELIKETETNRFFKLPGPGAGWVFEFGGGDANNQLVAEMKNIQAGQWWYRVRGDNPLEIQKSPSFDTRSGWLLGPKEVALVNLKCRVNGFVFMHLADGRGWVHELKPGAIRKEADTIVFSDCEADFIEVNDNRSFSNATLPPTNEVVEVGLWTYVTNTEPVLALGAKRFGTFIKAGEVVKIDKRCNSNGNPPGLGGPGVQNRRWLRLGGNQGWVPETDERGRKLMLEQAEEEVAYPTWFTPNSDPNRLKEAWHIGVM